jgi:hypothetical protein
MTTYKILTPNFVAQIVVSADAVIQVAPVLDWTIGKHFSEIRDYCRDRGWQIQPQIEEYRPTWLEHRGHLFEVHWNNETISRISLHEDGEIVDLTFAQLPTPLQHLLS